MIEFYFFGMPIKTLGSLGKIRVGRVTGNFWPKRLFCHTVDQSRTNTPYMYVTLNLSASWPSVEGIRILFPEYEKRFFY